MTDWIKNRAVWQAAALLVLLFLMGVATGWFVHSQLTRQHLERIRRMGSERGFVEQFYRVVQPDSAQRTRIEPLIEEFARQTEADIKAFRQTQRNRLDSLTKALEPILTPEQKERFERMKRYMHRRRSKPGKRGADAPKHPMPPPEQGPPPPEEAPPPPPPLEEG